VIICQNCGAQNEDHYKFCLSCGSEISQAAAKVADRPSTPAVSNVAADGPQENKPRIPNLKARLQALRTGRDALVERQGKVREQTSKKEQQLPGWTAPPMVATPVTSTTSPIEYGRPGKRGPESLEDETEKAELNIGSPLDSVDEPSPTAQAGPDGSDPVAEASERPDLTAADASDADDTAAALTDEPQAPADHAASTAAEDEAATDAVDELALDSESISPSSQSEPQVQLPAPMSAGGLSGSESDPEFDVTSLAQTQPAMERLVIQNGDESEDLPAETQSLRGNDADIGPEADQNQHVNHEQAQPDINESDGRETVVAPMVSDDMSPCPACGAMQPHDFKFCGTCGARLQVSGEDEKSDINADVQSIGQITLIHSDGSEGESFDLGDGNLVLGREHLNPLFSDDQCLSPVHAELVYSDGWLTIKDLGSLNGIFVRLRGDTRLIDGDRFRIGQQLFRFESLEALFAGVRPQNDGTHMLGSPTSGLWGRLVCISSAGDESMAWTLKTPEIYLGRDRGTICFPEDVFISGSHCRLRRDNDGVQISDLSSTNGTYVQLKSDFAVSTGDLILLGQRLYRFDLSDR